MKSHIDERKERQRAALDRVKSFSGPGFFGSFAALMTRGAAPTPKFIRRGYEANIVEDVNDFYRARGWRRRHCRSGQTRKERLNAQRGGRHAPKATQ